MAIDRKIIIFLKAQNFTGSRTETITYAAMNNEKNNKTLTDTRNQITKAFKGKNVKDITEIIEAVFTDKSKGTVSTMKTGSKVSYIYTNGRESSTIDFEIKNDTLIFTKGNKKKTLEIELSQKPEKPANWKDMSADIIKEMKNIKSLKEFKTFAANYGNTKP